MQSHPENSFQKKGKSLFHAVSDIPYSPSSSLDTQYSSSSEDDLSEQLVLYDPLANGNWEIEPVPDPVPFQHSPFLTCSSPHACRVLPSVGAFTVQCAECFKWRLIPTKQKYEEIREHILEVPFYCEVAREWRPDISCQDPEDITQDDSKLWAIDKPNIAQPPPGWQRLLRIRGEGCTKFADIYYMSPSGKSLRSMVEIREYLIEHPDYIRDGVRMSQFSFEIPKPLQEDYVRKPPPRHMAPYHGNAQANPISWAGADAYANSELLSLTYGEPDFLVWPPEMKRARTMPLKRRFSIDPVYNSSHS